jgi:tetratricopeptide (TPR) repeat protein
MTRTRAHLLLAALVAATFLIYLPGVAGPYLADDYPNLAQNRHLLIEDLSWNALREAATSSPSSRFHRPVSMLSFAFNYSLAGSMDPWSAKLFNVLLHAVIGIAVHALSMLLLPHLRLFRETAPGAEEIRTVALLAAGIWLLHPLFVSTVLYTVQRMAMLSTLFVVLGCLFYLHWRPRLSGPGSTLLLAGVIVLCTALGFLSKENGALLPGFLLLIELFVFRWRFGTAVPAPVRILLGATLIVPSLLIIAWLIQVAAGNWSTPSDNYAFSASDRLLSQSRILFSYLGWLLLLNPEPHSLFHQDVEISSGLLHPVTTLPALLFWIAAAALAALSVRRRQLAAFGVLWFLWGHVLESTALNLSPMFEHRNYLPGIGILLFYAAALSEGVRRLRIGPVLRNCLPPLLLILLPAWLLHERVGIWSDDRAMVLHSLSTQPDSALTYFRAARFLDSRGDFAGAMNALHEAQLLEPDEVTFRFAEIALHCIHRASEPFPDGLRRKLEASRALRLPTPTERNQFLQTVKVCIGSPANDSLLLGLYESYAEHRHPDVALMAAYGIGLIFMRRGDEESAYRIWDRAVEAHPDAERLRPLFEQMRPRP